MKVLLTGFEPFGGETLNPSAEVARAVAADPPKGVKIVTAELPVAFGPDVETAWPLWDEFQPDLFLSLGQGGGPAIRIERYAHNTRREREWRRGKLAPCEDDAPILPGEPLAYETPLPALSLESALREAGIPATVSRDAGDYVCNHLYYRSLHRADQAGGAPRVVFVHLPLLPEQAARQPGAPCLSREIMAQGVRQILEELRRSDSG
ncbi:MAG: pyroglutamyl-peptidase I [Armatimonadetes bacterium]|nr:pyroglutamyl-peptidase I [Armatimonadota bacterium]